MFNRPPLRIRQIGLVSCRTPAMLFTGGRVPHGRLQEGRNSLESSKPRPLNPLPKRPLRRRLTRSLQRKVRERRMPSTGSGKSFHFRHCRIDAPIATSLRVCSMLGESPRHGVKYKPALRLGSSSWSGAARRSRYGNVGCISAARYRLRRQVSGRSIPWRSPALLSSGRSFLDSLDDGCACAASRRLKKMCGRNSVSADRHQTLSMNHRFVDQFGGSTRGELIGDKFMGGDLS